MCPVFARAPIEGGLHMFCRNCGSKVEDGTRFCPVCGEPIAAECEAPAESQGGFQSAPAAESQPTTPAPAKAKRPKRSLLIAAVVAALLAAGGGAGYYFGIYAPEQAREAAEQEALAAKHAVRFSVSAQGWDTSAGASRLPVHITGKEERGKKVDAVRYVDSDGEGVELRRGSYEVEVAASPIAADGTIYAVPADKLDIKLGEKTAEKKTVDAGDVALEPVEAAEVTDDQIAAAKKYAEEDEAPRRPASILTPMRSRPPRPSAATTPWQPSRPRRRQGARRRKRPGRPIRRGGQGRLRPTTLRWSSPTGSPWIGWNLKRRPTPLPPMMLQRKMLPRKRTLRYTQPMDRRTAQRPPSLRRLERRHRARL